jgi:hypothetical protein
VADQGTGTAVDEIAERLKCRPSAATPIAADGDPRQGRDLVRASAIRTGVISVRGACTVLDVEGYRWALLGAPARAVTDGRRVTVRGSARAGAGRLRCRLRPHCPAPPADAGAWPGDDTQGCAVWIVSRSTWIATVKVLLELGSGPAAASVMCPAPTAIAMNVWLLAASAVP